MKKQSTHLSRCHYTYLSEALQATQPAHQSTQSSTQPEHSVKQEEEQYTAENIAKEPLQQAHAENTAENITKESLQQAHAENTAENIAKEPLQQAHAENTAEKPSDNKATIIKNTAQLSKIPRHILSTIPRQITT